MTTFVHKENPSQRVELHSQLHFGESEYFSYYNSPAFSTNHDAILYELLVDQDLLTPQRRLRADAPPIGATDSDRAVARQYGWDCQANVIQYAQPKWIHADLTRQEFIERLSTKHDASQRRPLWQLAQGTRTSSWTPPAAMEAATALLVGPPLVASSSQTYSSIKSFTETPGVSILNLFRSILWITIPAPEVSILLLDWSIYSLLNNANSSSNNNSAATLSQIALPLINAAVQGHFQVVKQLVFGQVVVQLANNNVHDASSSNNSLLIEQRNERAMAVLRQQRQLNQRIALLYGCNHCADLHQRLLAEGFAPVKTEWRTAWSVRLPTTTTEPAIKATLAVGLLLPLYFLLGGIDWIGAWHAVAKASEQQHWQDATLEAGLYLTRHVFMYVALSKYLLDWNTSATTTTTTTTTTDRKR